MPTAASKYGIKRNYIIVRTVASGGPKKGSEVERETGESILRALKKRHGVRINQLYFIIKVFFP